MHKIDLYYIFYILYKLQMDLIPITLLVPGGLYKILITDYNIARWAIFYGLREERSSDGISLHPEFDAGENARVAYHPNYIQVYSIIHVMDGTIGV